MDPDLDLSTDGAWHGLRPGMTRGEVVAIAAAAGLEAKCIGTDPASLFIAGEWCVSLIFESTGAQRLRQLSTDNVDLTWHDEPILGGPLDEVLTALGTDAEDAQWSRGDAAHELDTVNNGPATDEQLLAEGTLWLVPRGLGWVLCEGTVSDIVWRRAEDLPKHYEGRVTAAQLTLSKQPDLLQHLRKTTGHPLTNRPPFAPGWTPLQWLLALAFVVSMVSVVRLAITEQQLWQQAPELTGTVTAIKTLPGASQTKAIHIAFKDPAGQTQAAVLRQGEFYVAPREIGDAAPFSYVAGPPMRVKGPAHARDAAFLEYAPTGIVVFVIYVIASVLAGWFGRRSKAATIDKTSEPPVAGPGLPPGMPAVQKF